MKNAQILIDRIIKNMEEAKFNPQSIYLDVIKDIKPIIKNEIQNFSYRFQRVEIIRKIDAYYKLQKYPGYFNKQFYKFMDSKNTDLLIVYIYTDGTEEYIKSVEILYEDNTPNLENLQEIMRQENE